MKRLLTVLVLGLIITTLTGCFGSSKVEGEITVWWPGSAVEIASINKAAELYEAQNEGVTIKVVPQSTSMFYENYLTSLLGNNYPDIAYVDHVYVQSLAYDDLILNLTETGYADVEDLFIDSLIDPVSYNGDLYAYPISANVLSTVYNKTLIEEVLGRDMTNADLPQTYEELIALCDQIKTYSDANKKGYVPFTLPAGHNAKSMGAMAYLSFTARYGGQIMSDDLKTMQLNSDASLKAATVLKEMGTKGYTGKTFQEGLFESGQVAFIEMGSWKITEYDRIATARGIEYGYSSIIPFVEGGSTASALGLFSTVVTKQSPNAEIAADFARFLTTNDEIQLLHNTPQNLLPTTKTAIQDDHYKGDVWDVYVEQLNNIVARPGTPVWGTLESELSEFLTNLIAESREPNYINSLNIVLQRALNELYE